MRIRLGRGEAPKIIGLAEGKDILLLAERERKGREFIIVYADARLLDERNRRIILKDGDAAMGIGKGDEEMKEYPVRSGILDGGMSAAESDAGVIKFGRQLGERCAIYEQEWLKVHTEWIIEKEVR